MDKKKAFALFHQAANQGESDAQVSLGFAYEKGDGVSKDLKQALAWYKKAAEQGNTIAQHNLAYHAKNGRDS